MYNLQFEVDYGVVRRRPSSPVMSSTLHENDKTAKRIEFITGESHLRTTPQHRMSFR
jgi:hypothetical protein